MNKDEVEKFIKIQSQMEEMHNEISILSKKSKDDALSEFKLSFVNNLLDEANGILNEKYKPFKEFELFNKDKMPTNSDVVMVLSQYLACLENLRFDNIFYIYSDWHWRIVDEKKPTIKTGRPKKLS